MTNSEIVSLVDTPLFPKVLKHLDFTKTNYPHCVQRALTAATNNGFMHLQQQHRHASPNHHMFCNEFSFFCCFYYYYSYFFVELFFGVVMVVVVTIAVVVTLSCEK